MGLDDGAGWVEVNGINLCLNAKFLKNSAVTTAEVLLHTEYPSYCYSRIGCQGRRQRNVHVRISVDDSTRTIVGAAYNGIN